MDGVCEPPLDSSSQWGGWLRASPGRNNSGKEGTASGATSSNNNSFGSSQTGAGSRPRHEQGRVRDLPTKRNLHSEFSRSTDARTGGYSRSDKGEVNSPRKDTNRHEIPGENDLRRGLEQRREEDLRNKLVEQSQQRQREESWEAARVRKGKDKAGSSYGGRHANEAGKKEEYGPGMHGDHGRRRGTFRRKPRQESEHKQYYNPMHRYDKESRKRGPKQMWVAKGDLDRQSGHDAFIRDTRQKTSTVFDRISVNNDESADPGRQGRREQ